MVETASSFASSVTTIPYKKSWDTVLIKEDFSVSDIFVFFYHSPHFNVAAAAKSIGQSNILNTEKGEGGIATIQCNFIENKGKGTDYSYFLMSVSTTLHGIVDLMLSANVREGTLGQ